MAFIPNLTFRRNNQVASMAEAASHAADDPLILFHFRVADHLLPCARRPRGDKDDRGLPFLRALLGALLLCDADFLPAAPGPLPDILLRALDIVNAASASLDSLRASLHLARAAAAALLSVPPQQHRARRALAGLLPALDPRSAPLPRRAPARSLSLNLRGGWSAARQLQAMAALLHAPRGGDAAAAAAYAMGSVVVLAMWCLAATFPSGREREDSAVKVSAAPRQLPWAAPAGELAERVKEEWRRRERRGAVELTKLARAAVEAAGESDGAAAAKAAAELAATCSEVEEEVGRLQEVLREVFHRMARTRMRIMEVSARGVSTSDSADTSNSS